MSYGILIQDANGRVIVDENTFTVRLVDRFTVQPGTTIYNRPLVKAGMFCAFQSLISGGGWVTPRGIVTNGRVEVSALLSGGGYSSPVECLVMGYV